MSDRHQIRIPFKTPEFEPIIPSHLIKGCDDQQKFLLERISVLMQQSEWQMDHLAAVHDYCSNINGKVVELEEFRQKTVNKEEAEEKSFKYKKYLMWAGALVIYPLYLATLSKTGFSNIIDWVTRLGAP